MLDRLRELRDQLDAAIAAIEPLAPLLAAVEDFAPRVAAGTPPAQDPPPCEILGYTVVDAPQSALEAARTRPDPPGHSFR